MEEPEINDVRLAYVNYMKLPLATLSKDDRATYWATNEIYSNRWFIQTGSAMVAPHPHRHYTFVEFAKAVKSDPELANRFGITVN